ncbi:ATP-dependent RNA helicase HrpA [Polaromonas sp. C04]|uniref:ATP-dependent RNA helicase HrpA n=1 Tax=Polaromonas sp. C04 TaxID=1945857 RepID=UPI0009858DA7|nr:ATP-dependent RNA helicase HrpA [Polaromonas sp. C04]OOG54238.1 ATP-dependent RNA helicase HrpA [Polaromonas sp. C04]
MILYEVAALPVQSSPSLLKIEFPEALPVSAKREDIMAAMAAHQVIIVCGETGSGKTTQLPKIALAMGRGKLNDPQRGKLIGHTQPRRIAASSVAKRIAEELKTPLGEVVGFKVRFQDRVGRDASVKLMTDGILLAETQTDPLLKAYDTLIIDEAHERSLNIDFLLGYLREILPRRPDLKVVVTSATIDAQRFADHFASSRPAPGRPKPGVAPSGGSDDAQRGAWGQELIPAPVIMVSGRMFPVEQRWRPFEESRDYGLNEAIADAVDELWSGRPAPGRPRTDTAPGPSKAQGAAALGGSDDAQREAWGPSRGAGDILVFLPGEREIREAADHLRKHLSHQPVFRDAEVLPLFARLSQAEQDRIFDRHSGRRIVLATNVAETSLTVPGINYVIDAGTARVKRYSFRSKVEQLLVEPISQAAANQRAGRCGRVANGICIRLYDQQDFDGRPRFTDPEILRSSLAGVILRMKSLHLGVVEDFPFIERPQGRAIADGYQLLAELGAVDDANELTAIGQELARLPLDPRVGRMILEARSRQALDEVMVIASALSVQDVRDRPMEAQAAADQAHAKFDDDKSEFSGYLKLWKWLESARGGPPPVRHSSAALPPPRHPRAGGDPSPQAAMRGQAAGDRATVDSRLRGNDKVCGNAGVRGEASVRGNAGPRNDSAPAHRLSNRQYEQLLRQNFINIRRVREWRDIYSQLHTVVAEHKWQLNTQPASYEQLHLSMLAGLLGNVGCKLEDEEVYLGARGIKFYRHPGAHLGKKPGRWIVAAELVETTRLFGRGIANIEPPWIEQVAGHLLKKQMLDPHWEKKAAQVTALERATLYGLAVYNGRRVNFGRIDPVAAREIFIREALVAGNWDTRLPFLAANLKLISQVQDLEHKARRQDVLVDEELIYAFYDQQLPADICSGAGCESWYKDEVRRQPQLLLLTREELMRHEAAGITTQAFPKTLRLGGVDCMATYLHEPGDARDGVTVDVPLFALNQVNEERCEWLVPGMLRDKVQALIKTLHQRARSRLVPLPETATRMAEALNQPQVFGGGSLVDAVLKLVRDATSLDIKRADMKLDMLPPHLFMNFRVLDEHGRQLGTGRNLGALKGELGSQARGAFQALAGLRSRVVPAASGAGESAGSLTDSASNRPPAQAGRAQSAPEKIAPKTVERYTRWSFGELPELMEIRKGSQTLIGFPALIDLGDAVTIEVFDEPDVAAAKHRAGLRRLFSLQIRDALKYLEKNLPDLQKMATQFMLVGRAADNSGGGTLEELRQQIIEVALDRAFLLEPLPTHEAEFTKRVEDGRGRLTLIANEVARLAGGILTEFAVAQRKIKDTKNATEAALDAAQQLQRLMPKRFLAATPYGQLQHFARYLKAITLRLEKWRADPARDAARLAELRPQEQRYWRLVAERKGAVDARMQEFRWLLEELRVSFFAQELRTPQPVSIKRLEKLWIQLNS